MTRQSGYEKTGGHASPGDPVTQLPQVPAGPGQGGATPSALRAHGTCRHCGRDFALTKSGKVYRHNHPTDPWQNCPGWGLPPAAPRAVTP